MKEYFSPLVLSLKYGGENLLIHLELMICPSSMNFFSCLTPICLSPIVLHSSLENIDLTFFSFSPFLRRSFGRKRTGIHCTSRHLSLSNKKRNGINIQSKSLFSLKRKRRREKSQEIHPTPGLWTFHSLRFSTKKCYGIASN